MSGLAKIKLNKSYTKVSINNSLCEIESEIPIVDEKNVSIYRKNLTLNNDGVTTEMTVDGSLSSQKFFIESETDGDIHITSVSFFIAAEVNTCNLNEFAATTELTNGCDFIFKSKDNGEIFLNQGIKTNYDLLKMCNFLPNFGNTTNAFKVLNVFSASDEGYIPVFYFKNYGYEPDYRGGIILRSGERDCLIFKINDDLNLPVTQIARLNAIAYGYKVIR